MYERDERRPDFELLNKFADYFEVSTDYLLGRTDMSEISKEEKDEAEFQAFANDPELKRWYRELPKSKEEDLRMLRSMWEVIKKKQNKRTCSYLHVLLFNIHMYINNIRINTVKRISNT